MTFQRENEKKIVKGNEMVKIIGLVENTAVSAKLKNKHGLCLYVQTDKHKILFDVGPNDLFLKNAEKLGVDIADVDTVIISHGHVDHCGGLKYFLAKNSKAKVYIRPKAIQKHYVKVLGIPFYVGIERHLEQTDRFVFTEELCIADDELMLFSDVSGHFPLPKSDENLLAEKDGKIVADDFSHEQNLILTVDGKTILICGCAHAGVVNIVDRAKELVGKISAVVGGFHLFEPTKKRYESDEYIDNVAAVLAQGDTEFYTCHCTGEQACVRMKKQLGDRLHYLRVGSKIYL